MAKSQTDRRTPSVIAALLSSAPEMEKFRMKLIESKLGEMRGTNANGAKWRYIDTVISWILFQSIY